MKRFLGAACILASLVAFSQPSWADPTRAQVQAEMAAGQWQQAHDDLMVVLRVHPDSHQAKSLLATVDTHLAQPGNGGIVPLSLASPQGHHGKLLPIVLLVGGIWLLFRLMRARQRRAMGGMYGGLGGQGFGRGPTPFNPNMGPPGYNANMYPPPPATGGGMMSGLAGGLLGGVIAEELLGNRDQPMNQTIINENGDNAGNDGWDNNNNSNDWSQQADNWNDDSGSDGWS